MIEISPVSPEQMMAEQRRREIVSLLARGIVRLRNATTENTFGVAQDAIANSRAFRGE